MTLILKASKVGVGQGRRRGGKYLRRYVSGTGKMVYVYKDPGTAREHQAVAGKATHTLEALADAYRRREPGQGRAVPIASEGDLHLILDHMTFCFVSAGRNLALGEEKMTDAQVNARHGKLLGTLRRLGYAYTPGIGKYGALEKSVIVMTHDANKKEMKALGESLNQDSVLFCEGGKNQLIHTTGPKKGKVGMSGRGHEMVPEADDYFTQLTIAGKRVKFTMRLKEVVQKALRLIWRVAWRG